MVQFDVGVTVLRQLRITRLDSDYFDQEDV